MKTEIEQAVAVLKKGGLILYPTDTVWGIGCDATNQKAVDKIFQLKKRNESSALICLVNDLKMLEMYVESIPNAAYDIIKYAQRPTTIIYDTPIRVASNLVASDNSLGIRVIKEKFCEQLIRSFRKPIVSTSANISGDSTPNNFQEISAEILEGVDYIVNLQPGKNAGKPSAIIKLKSDGTVKIIRE